MSFKLLTVNPSFLPFIVAQNIQKPKQKPFFGVLSLPEKVKIC
jgi:hypothetical protein